MGSSTEVAAMRRAVELSARGLPTAFPNPVVGCVILAADGVTTAGEGWHERAGGPHAEVVALRAAGWRARGGTAVVTLEPCAHHGRTPPCTEALLRAGVRRVVFAVRDPDPVAAGGGTVLAGHGVDVEGGVLADEAATVNARWLAVPRRKRPYVTWKYAASLDGRVAATDGSSRWITGPEARQDVHRLRAAHGAVVVGIGTVLTDDPQLTVRIDGEETPPGAQPLRVVVDTHGRTPGTAKVRDGAARTLIAVGPDAAGPTQPSPAAGGPAAAPVETVVLPAKGDGLDLHALLAALGERGVRAVLVEGGPTLAGSFISEGLVDRVVGYVAPALIGGPPAFPALRGKDPTTIAQATRLRLDDVTRIGNDLRLTAYPIGEGED